ncbi:Coenzyme F420 hydrogenase/dehydrogenase, beta subunit C-terminal domain [Denitrificimonas caeni]|uniref:Coenzyme F420 hydrogenase/dehydrogenase, beta subunit C-terminal domain n=1 Tax=Denitrificimonas caeni TaxID=521720 RepID=UPI001962A9B2|nr:Coenzyme F420 hydrogenase/dehydrogenase, beta subunit C-terminal domain [Denitrificimonas caeni]
MLLTDIADISLGDAWLEPYSQDGRGTSVIITRSSLAEVIIQEGASNSALFIESISSDTMRAFQQGSYNHRHEGLYVRIKEAQKKSITIPEKRYGKNSVSLDATLVQKLRRASRKKSLEVWSQSPSAAEFDKEMHKMLLSLRLATRGTYYRRKGFKHLVTRVIVRIMRQK